MVQSPPHRNWYVCVWKSMSDMVSPQKPYKNL